MALLTHGSAPAPARVERPDGTGEPARSRRLRLTRHRSGAAALTAVQPGTLHPQPDAEGVTRIDLTAFEQEVRRTPAAGFPAPVTPARGIALPVVDDDAWAGTLLPHEAEPFPVTALREPQPGEHWALDDVAGLRRAVTPAPEPAPAPAVTVAPAAAATPAVKPAVAPVAPFALTGPVRAGRADVPVPPLDELPEIEPLALAQIRQELPLIPLEPVAVTRSAPAEPETPAQPAPAAEPVTAAKPPTAANPPTTAKPVAVATPARGVTAAAPGRHPALARAVAGLGLAAGAAIAIGSAALIATVSTPAQDTSPTVTPTITVPGP